MKQIITISREFSSGGREIAKRLADELKIAYYDKQIINEVVKNSNLSEKDIKHYSEAVTTRIFPYIFSNSFKNISYPIEDAVQYAQTDTLRKLTRDNSAVIVGRMADVSLKDQNPFKVFIYSSDIHKRIKRCYDKVPSDRDKTEREITKEIYRIDNQRIKYYEFYTQQKWANVINYNLCIDTSAVTIKQAVQMIKLAVTK